MYGLTYYDGGARGFYSKKPIHSPEDMEGMLVRVQNSRLMMDMVEALGASRLLWITGRFRENCRRAALLRRKIPLSIMCRMDMMK